MGTMSRGKLIFNISQLPTGSYEITGSFFGTASWAESASYALTARTASYSLFATSASFSNTASYSLTSINTASINNATITFTRGNGTSFPIIVNNVANSISSSYATTASFALNGGGGNSFPFSGSAVITGSLQIKSDINNIFLIKNFNDQPILTVSQSGVIVIVTQSIELTGPAPNGGICFTSGSFFVGLD
jgi:hypothetical protein